MYTAQLKISEHVRAAGLSEQPVIWRTLESIGLPTSKLYFQNALKGTHEVTRVGSTNGHCSVLEE